MHTYTRARRQARHAVAAETKLVAGEPGLAAVEYNTTEYDVIISTISIVVISNSSSSSSRCV